MKTTPKFLTNISRRKKGGQIQVFTISKVLLITFRRAKGEFISVAATHQALRRMIYQALASTMKIKVKGLTSLELMLTKNIEIH
jgi:hypothetical protein